MVITGSHLTDRHIQTMLEDGAITDYLGEVAAGRRAARPGHNERAIRERLAEIYTDHYEDTDREMAPGDLQPFIVRLHSHREWMDRMSARQEECEP